MKHLSNHDMAELLRHVLPTAASFSGETIVIVLTGPILRNQELLQKAIMDVIFLRELGVFPVILHGDYSLVEDAMKQWGISIAGLPQVAANQHVDRLAHARREQIDVIEMILSGHINKQLMALCIRQGGMAIGVSGRDGNLIQAKKMRRTHRTPDSNIEHIMDNFLEGEPTMVNPDILVAMEETDIIPIVASLGVNEKYEVFYVCPLTCGAMLSSALVADKLIIYTDGPLTLENEPVHELTIAEADKLISQKKIPASHVEALSACIQAVSQHTCEAYLINAQLPNSLILELFSTNSSGTCIVYE